VSHDIARLYARAVALARRYVRHHDAEDVAQNALLYALQHDTADVDAWLGLSMHRRCVDHIRATIGKNGVRRAISLSSCPEAIHPHTRDRDSVAEEDDVRHLLRDLKPRQREVILRTYLGGETLREVAESWGVTEARAVQVRTEARLALGGLPPTAGWARSKVAAP
jgi:RNA polymerase sigma factor (sigma-70 family)